MASDLGILTAQINPTVGHISENRDMIIDIIQSYQATHDIIVFPELALSGYPPEDYLLRPAFRNDMMQALELIRENTHDCHVILGHPDWIDNNCYNTASILYQGNTLTKYHKQMLPNTGVFDELRYFKAGSPVPCIFQVKSARLGLCICEDFWHDTPMTAILDHAPDIIIAMNASPFDHSKFEKRLILAQKYSTKKCSIVYLNMVGGQDELVFDGMSFAVDASGVLSACAPAFETNISTITWSHGRLSGIVTLAPDPIARIYRAIVLGLHDYIEKNKFSGVILGLSGGIDSALVLAMAVDALGAGRVSAVMMPSRFTADMSNEDAAILAHNLHVDHTILSIESLFQTACDTLASVFHNTTPDLTEQNIQARLRGILLMALSNKFGKLVLSTSNKSESAMGYATLYGDMAGGYAPLKDVLKTQVYALAAYRNQLSPCIPERVIKRAPSAELAADQKDQDTLPPYPVLDAIIQAYMENTQDLESIVQQGYDITLVTAIIQKIRQNEYKRRQSAIGPKISPVAFGRDWRYPITC